VSLNQPLLGAEDMTLADMVEDTGAAETMEHVEDNLFTAELRAALDKAMAKLPVSQLFMWQVSRGIRWRS
jgi:DNA-directed RNA polymerase sigma subunit (sigma70/sigma32)